MPYPHYHLFMGRQIRRHGAHVNAARAACPGQFTLCRLRGTLRAGYSDPAAFFFKIQSSSINRSGPKYLSRSIHQARRFASLERQVRNDAHLCFASRIQRSYNDTVLADRLQLRFHSGPRQPARRYRSALSRTANRRLAQLLYDRRGGHSRAAQAPRCRDLNIEHIAPGACPAGPAASPHGHPGQDRQSDILPHALCGPILLVRRRHYLDWLSNARLHCRLAAGTIPIGAQLILGFRAHLGVLPKIGSLRHRRLRRVPHDGIAGEERRRGAGRSWPPQRARNRGTNGHLGYSLSAALPQLSADAPRSRFAANRRGCASQAAVIRGRGHVEGTPIAIAYQTFAMGVPLGHLPRCATTVRSNSIVGRDKTAACIPEDVWSGPEYVWSGPEDVCWSGPEDVWSGPEDVWSGPEDVCWSGP